MYAQALVITFHLWLGAGSSALSCRSSYSIFTELLPVQFGLRGPLQLPIYCASREGLWRVGAVGRPLIWHLPNFDSVLSSEKKRFNKNCISNSYIQNEGFITCDFSRPKQQQKFNFSYLNFK